MTDLWKLWKLCITERFKCSFINSWKLVSCASQEIHIQPPVICRVAGPLSLWVLRTQSQLLWSQPLEGQPTSPVGLGSCLRTSLLNSHWLVDTLTPCPIPLLSLPLPVHVFPSRLFRGPLCAPHTGNSGATSSEQLRRPPRVLVGGSPVSPQHLYKEMPNRALLPQAPVSTVPRLWDFNSDDHFSSFCIFLVKLSGPLILCSANSLSLSLPDLLSQSTECWLAQQWNLFYFLTPTLFLPDKKIREIVTGRDLVHSLISFSFSTVSVLLWK